MSVSNLTGQEYLLDVEVLVRVFSMYLQRWAAASTYEQRMLIEAEAMALLQQLLELDVELEKLTAGGSLNKQELDRTYEPLGWLIISNRMKLNKLTELFLRHFNSSKLLLEGSFGKLKKKKIQLIFLQKIDGK